MNLTNKGKIYLAVCALSFIFSYLIITLNYFPFLGMSASLTLFAIFSYKLKGKNDTQTRKYFTLTLIFSAFLFIRSEPLITFFNLSVSLTFAMLMLTPFENERLGFLEHFYKPVIYLIKSVFGRSKYYLERQNPKGQKESSKKTEHLLGIIISSILLAILLPVLSTINPFFKNLVNNIWNILNLENILSNIGYETVFIWIMRFIFTLGFIFLLPKLLTFTNKNLDLNLPFKYEKGVIPLHIPKLVIAFTLCVFFVTQLQFYLASDSTLAGMGISHSEHVNEVFGQLSFVAIILFLLIYNSKHIKKLDVFLNWALGVQGVFLTLMAYKSDFEYINTWGLTYKRLYGLAVATWVLGIFIILFINYHKRNNVFAFVKNSIFYSAVTLIMVNVINFDYLIYHFDKSVTGQGVDYTYLSKLSPDSLSYKEQFIALEVATEDELLTSDYNNENPLILLYNIERLQEKYERLDLRTFNLMEYLQYDQVKSINTKPLRFYYTSKLTQHSTD